MIRRTLREWQRIGYGDDDTTIPTAEADRIAAVAARSTPGLDAVEGSTYRRILSDGDVRWISARGQGDDLGMVSRKMFGVFLDMGLAIIVLLLLFNHQSNEFFTDEVRAR